MHQSALDGIATVQKKNVHWGQKWENRVQILSHMTSFALGNNRAKEHHLLMNKHVELQEEKGNSSLPANKRLQEILDVADE